VCGGRKECILQLTSMQEFGHIGRCQTSKDLELLEVADMNLVVLAKGDGICKGFGFPVVSISRCGVRKITNRELNSCLRAMAMVLSLIMMYCIWLLDPEDQREDWSWGLLVLMFSGRYEAE